MLEKVTILTKTGYRHIWDSNNTHFLKLVAKIEFEVKNLCRPICNQKNIKYNTVEMSYYRELSFKKESRKP